MRPPIQGDLLGVALAGGQSERMGRDKATLEIGGVTLTDWAVARLRQVVPHVVVADRGRGVATDALSVADDEAFAGPAAGLLGVGARFPGRSLLVLACDLPAVPAALLDHLARTQTDADLVAPCHGPDQRTEPLCARWSVRALARLRAEAERGHLALRDVARRSDLRVYRLDDTALRGFGDPRAMLANINTPADWAGVAHLARPPVGR